MRIRKEGAEGLISISGKVLPAVYEVLQREHARRRKVEGFYITIGRVMGDAILKAYDQPALEVPVVPARKATHAKRQPPAATAKAVRTA